MQAWSWIVKFYPFDLALDLMAFVLKLDLDIVRMYVYTENKVPSSANVTVWTERDTDTRW